MGELSNQWFRLLEGTIGQSSQHFFDDFIEEKCADQFKNEGIDSIIIRRQIGNCCDYCANLVGMYDYGNGDYPDDIFKRHKNCKCLVTVKTRKGGYQNVWTKKEYSSQRDARIDKNEGLIKKQINEKARKNAIAKAIDRGESFIDATEYWDNKNNEMPEVTNTPKKFRFRGVQYEINGGSVKLKPSETEKKAAAELADQFGGKVQLVPKISPPYKGVETPDFIYRGFDLDHKNLEIYGKEPIYGAISHKLGQAKSFLIDISNFTQYENEIIANAESCFARKNTKSVKRIMLKKDGKVFKVLESVKKK